MEFPSRRPCTTSSPHISRRVGSPLLDGLFAAGLACPGPLGGGLNCDATGRLIDAGGRPSAVLFNVGPGRLGTLLESIAVPELRQQADDLAATLADGTVRRQVA